MRSVTTPIPPLTTGTSVVSHHSALKKLSPLVWEGAHSNVFIVLTGGAFLTGIALLLGADDFYIGLLASAPFLMQSAQLLSPYLFPKPTRSKSKIGLTLAVSRLLWLAAIPLLFFDGAWRLPALIAITVVSGLLTMISAPAWITWMAEVVPTALRGRFFSRRNAAIAATTVAATILGSLVLDWTRADAAEEFGFAAILLIAALGGLMAWRSMLRTPEKIVDDDSIADHRPDLLLPLRDPSFRRVLLAFGTWNLSIGISAAFFAPHMLTNLDMGFFQIGLYTCAVALVAILSSGLWGKLIDRFGSKPVLNVCSFGVALIPVFWLFMDGRTLWILIPEAIYSGLLWAGFNLAAFTLPLDRSPKEDRSVYLSVFAAVTGLAFFLASVLAGYLSQVLADWSWTLGGMTYLNYHVLFAVSTLLRLATAGLISAFHEPDEIRLPAMVQLMGYSVLKRVSIGRQLFGTTKATKKKPTTEE